MKKLNLLVLLFIVNSCVIERELEYSIFLDQVQQLSFTPRDTLFSVNEMFNFLYYEYQYLDQEGNIMEIENLTPEIFVDGKLSENGIFETPALGEIETYAKIGTTESERHKIRVVDPSTYISKVELDFSPESRNHYAIAGKSIYNFEVKTLNFRGHPIDNPYTLYINDIPQLGFKDIEINTLGNNRIYVESNGTRSNTLSIRARRDIEFQKRELPVIFHVIHQGEPLGSFQNRSMESIHQELEKTNLGLANLIGPDHLKSPSAVDTSIKLVLADRDMNGNYLPERGINRFQVQASNFEWQSDQTNKLIFDWMWDPTKYINIFVLEVPSGWSWAWHPTLQNNFLSGLNTINPSEPLYYPYSIVLNNRGFGQNILTHEIGHFLGLFHPFLEEEVDECYNPDFVNDTNHYLKIDENIMGIYRQNCDNQWFYANNFMDYYNWYNSNSFTYGQRDRMQTVIAHAMYFPRDTQSKNARQIPFIKGNLDPNIKPVVCTNPTH